MKFAKVSSVKIDSKTREMRVRSGKKGTGKVLFSCEYWPHQAKSIATMQEWLANFEATSPELEILPEELSFSDIGEWLKLKISEVAATAAEDWEWVERLQGEKIALLAA